MSDISADGEAAWAEHLAECDPCLKALLKGDSLPDPNCIEDDDDRDFDWEEWEEESWNYDEIL